jgi:hypothetical protein
MGFHLQVRMSIWLLGSWLSGYSSDYGIWVNYFYPFCIYLLSAGRLPSDFTLRNKNESVFTLSDKKSKQI